MVIRTKRQSTPAAEALEGRQLLTIGPRPVDPSLAWPPPFFSPRRPPAIPSDVVADIAADLIKGVVTVGTGSPALGGAARWSIVRPAGRP